MEVKYNTMKVGKIDRNITLEINSGNKIKIIKVTGEVTYWLSIDFIFYKTNNYKPQFNGSLVVCDTLVTLGNYNSLNLKDED